MYAGFDRLSSWDTLYQVLVQYLDGLKSVRLSLGLWHVCVHVHTCMYICMYVCMYVCMYKQFLLLISNPHVFVCVCVCVSFTNIYIQTYIPIMDSTGLSIIFFFFPWSLAGFSINSNIFTYVCTRHLTSQPASQLGLWD